VERDQIATMLQTLRQGVMEGQVFFPCVNNNFLHRTQIATMLQKYTRALAVENDV
jgi:hypothetical protein